MNRYDEYRDSGIEWIGEIPSTWNLVRGRMVFFPKKELNRNLQCQNLLSLTLSGVLNKDVESSEGLRPETYSSYQIFQKKDLVFKMIDLENVKTSRVGIVHEIGIMSPVYLRHEPLLDKIDPKFAYWFYYDLYKKEIYNSIGSGVRSSLSSGNLLELELPLPPLETQKLISRYLDKKTEQIDRLVGKIQKKIKLLKEQRAALINHCVSKGLNPNVEMKDSGVEWIGQIPTTWELSRAGKFFTERTDKVDDVTYPPLSVTMSGIVDQLSDVAKSDDSGNRKLVIKNDFVINSRSDRKGSSGISPRDGSVSLINIVLEPRDINPQYIQHLFKSYFFKEEHFRNGKGIHWDLWTTRWEQLKNINIPVPPIEEQKLISRYLDKKTEQIDLLVGKIQRKIELFKDYRQSLISSVVTGEIRITEDMI